MKKIVGVRFRHTGSSYYFDPKDLELQVGMGVIVKTEDGTDYGTVSVPPIEKEEDELPSILKQIVRIATEEDKQRLEENKEKEKEAYRIGKEKIAEQQLPMKLIHAEYTFERNKLLFYFSAEGRVDFRELVRVLASVFKTRIELRQIGVRDEAKLLGGIGICGRPLCCATYLSGFAPVSIKMAKEQNLSLNPTKISGLCGRLMCCLNNEEETYEYLNRKMPKNGDFAVNIEGSVGVIRSVNILKQTVLVMFEDGDTREMKEYTVDEVGITPRREGVPSDSKIEAQRDELRKKNDDLVEAEYKKKTEEQVVSEEKKPDNRKPRKRDRNNDKGQKGKSFDGRRSGSQGEDEKKNNDNRGQNGRNNNGKGGNGNNGKPSNNKPQNSRKNDRKNTSNRNSDRNFDKPGNDRKEFDKGSKAGDNPEVRDNKEGKEGRDNRNRRNRFDKKKNNGGDNKPREKKDEDPGRGKKNNNKKRRNGGYSRGYRGDRKEDE